MKHGSGSNNKNSSFFFFILKTRRDAMQKLNHIVSGEIVQNKHWPQLRRNLMDVMGDSDDQLSVSCAVIL